MASTVRTRFAPSPTGYLHIGGVRTALFNWLFARRHGGSFVLRVDDTDVERNVEQALAPILDGFRWLGLDWDEGPEVGGAHGPYFQSARQERYREVVAALVESGHAYWDYATTEELAAERELAVAAGKRFVYSRRFMAETAADRARYSAEGRAGVVRLRMPREGACRFTDLIRGPVEFEWALEQDHVVQRADGSCLYNLASVVDDHDMRISHVIRAEEHLSNTPRQIFIATALGWQPPEHAHLPFVAEPGSRNKLSKRKLAKYVKQGDFAKLFEHGRKIADALGLHPDDETFNPVLVDFYRVVGYLPAALLNYLLLLGWALDDRTEEFTRAEMIEHFALERVNRAPASFDPAKLVAFQGKRMLALPLERRVELLVPYLERAGHVPTPAPPEARRTAARVAEAAGDRIVVAGDVLEYAAFFVADEALVWDEAAFDKRVRAPGAAERLGRLRQHLAGTSIATFVGKDIVESWSPTGLEALVGEFAGQEGIKLPDVVHALRVAVTGKPVGFGLYDALAILGRARTLARIDRAVARAGGAAV